MPGQSEGRRHTRKKVVQEGRIRIAGQGNEIPCMVRDVSLSGVRLRVPIGFKPPETFWLVVPGLQIDAALKLAWSSEHSLGASFISRAGQR